MSSRTRQNFISNLVKNMQNAEDKQSRIWFEDWWKKHGVKSLDRRCPELMVYFTDIKKTAWEAWRAGRDEL